MSRDEEREDREVENLLAQLDHPTPRVTFADVARRAAGRRHRFRRLAAGIALVVGVGGVAYAFPGSPLPRWVDRVFGWAAQVGRPDPSGDDVPGRQDPFLPGIALAPPGDLLLRFESVHADGRLTVSLIPGASVSVRAPEGAATFSSGEAIIVVRDRRPGTAYEVQIPEKAPRVEIQVNGRRVFLKEGSRVTPPLGEGGSAIVLPMGSSGP